MHPARATLALVLTLAACSASGAAPIDFNRDIRPILSDHCFACHGPDDAHRKARLRLDHREHALRPSRSGTAAIVPGQTEASELVARIRTSNPNDIMPPPELGKPLSPGQIELLERWIKDGAEYREHWSFVPPQRPPVPPSQHPSPIDAFIEHRLQPEDLNLRPEADRTTLARRATFDLTGLPPTPEELDAFLADDSPKAYEKLVDRLLASPRYGERLAVDWLDAARYADTHGYHLDSGRDMTAWRDGVIRAFNANQPYDQFTIEQLAGDLLPNATRDQKIASGFNRNNMVNYEGGAIPEEYHYTYLVDRVNTTSTVWLGLTFACAQCHDHKYDPISMKEYYQFFAFFNQVPERGLDGNRGNAVPILKLPTPDQETELARLKEEFQQAEHRLQERLPALDTAQTTWESDITSQPESLSALPETIRTALAVPASERSDDHRNALQKHYRENISPEFAALQKDLNERRKARDDFEASIPSTMVMAELEKPRETFMRLRGEYDKLSDKVEAATPAALLPFPEGAPANRLSLARWLVDPQHPLTARVTVNRYWQLFFGYGLVKSTEDFGSQGDWPSHPELLDWLARDFIESGWDVKRLHRLMVTSATYRQSTRAPQDLYLRDPENRLLARGPRFRLQAEFIRDQALAVSGLLEGRIGGASVFPYQPSGLWEELSMREDSHKFSAQSFVQSQGRDLYRRSMYTFWKRSSPPPQLYTFDAPDRETCTVKRPRTNTPLQALILLNDPTYIEASRKLAERLLHRDQSDADRIAFAFRLATARTPTAAEAKVLLRVLDQQRLHYRHHRDDADRLLSQGDSPRDATLDPVELAAWTLLSSTILNLDETVTRG
jgi:hypothetical protein